MNYIIEQIKQKINDYEEALKIREENVKELKEAFTSYIPDCVKKSIEREEQEIKTINNYIAKLKKALEVLEA